MTDAIQFLLDRLREFEGEIDSEDLAREWFGHVTPAIVRTEYQLQAEHEPAEHPRRYSTLRACVRACRAKKEQD